MEGSATLPGSPPWLADLRLAGAMRWSAAGLPGSRDEEWRFTPVAAIGETEWRLPVEGPVPVRDAIAVADLDPSWPALVMVDGRFAPSLSRLDRLPTGVTALPLAEAIARDLPGVAEHLGHAADPMQTPFTALSAATFSDGLYLSVAPGATPAVPMVLLHVATDASHDALLAPRSLVLVGQEARATLLEQYIALTDRPYFTNAVIELRLAAASWLEHVRVQRENEAAWHIGFTQVDQSRDSHYRSFALAMGGRLARHNLHVRHHEPAVESLLYGLYLTRGTQLADTHSAIFHDQPNCNSWEVYKGVLADQSRAVFNGKVLVAPEAQKTDAKQTNRNLLLSDRAKVDTKPQLEIFADDVRCTHGATVGRLNEQQRFYLRSRGIGGQQAEQLLIWAFAAEVIAEVEQPAIRAELERIVHERLEALTA